MARTYDDEPTASAAEMVLRAQQMASILAIPGSAFTGREQAAYAVMSHLYSMARLADHGQRHRYGMEILTFTNKPFPNDQPDTAEFFHRVQGVVIEMQEMPSWFHEISETDNQLVDEYVTIWYIQAGMQAALGISGFSAAGTGGKMVSSAVRAAATSTATTAMARAGAAAGSAGRVLQGAFTGGYVARASIIGFVVGTLVYTTLDDDKVRIGKEITRRYQEHQLSADLYKRAFGDGTPLPERYVFKADGVP